MAIQYLNPFTLVRATLTEKGLVDIDGNAFPLVKGAYRVVSSEDNYTSNFGFQWNKFAETQIDKSTKLEISKKRFFAETGWDKEDISNQNILEVGCGAGRFTQIVLDFTKANLYSIDFSNAVEANFNNNGPNERLSLFKASIYEMPFVKEQFDKVFCLGVLQHTPNVEKSLKAMIDMVRPGGELVVDFYPYKGWWTKCQAKYILRPFTRKMDHEKLFKKIDRNIDWMIKVQRFLSKIGLKSLSRFLPICDIDGTLPQNLSPKQLREMCILDTFDMFSPEYDQPQKINHIAELFIKYGMKVTKAGIIKYENCKATIVKGIKK